MSSDSLKKLIENDIVLENIFPKELGKKDFQRAHNNSGLIKEIKVEIDDNGVQVVVDMTND